MKKGCPGDGGFIMIIRLPGQPFLKGELYETEIYFAEAVFQQGAGNLYSVADHLSCDRGG